MDYVNFGQHVQHSSVAVLPGIFVAPNPYVGRFIGLEVPVYPDNCLLAKATMQLDKFSAVRQYKAKLVRMRETVSMLSKNSNSIMNVRRKRQCKDPSVP